MGDLEIIYKDEAFFVINKPSGWITNEAQTTTNQPVVQTWVKNNLKTEISKSYEYRNGIVHRLDKETSGILLIASSKEAFHYLQLQFKHREVEKSYVALVHGILRPETGVINAPVGRLPWRRDRFGVLLGGREASTSYSLISKFQMKNSKEKYSLVECFPKTGRTHQIRIHLSHIGYPIVSDSFYAGRKIAKSDRVWCPRLFLHAKKIRFTHPVSRNKVEYNAKFPKDLEDVLKLLAITD